MALKRMRPLVFLGLLLPWMAVHPAAAADFHFNWQGTPAAPLPWVPGAVNDWDLFVGADLGSEQYPLGFVMPAQHGADCSAPPAIHPITNLLDGAFICKNHFMTAVKDNEVFFAPAQLADFSHGAATVSWQVST